VILNEFGCYVEGFETFETHAKKTFGFIRVNIGQEHEKWGYAVGFMGFIGGHLYSLTPERLIYSSRNDAVQAAIEEIKTIHCENTGILHYMIQDLVEQMTIEPQLDLFGEPKKVRR
jgi:hypothetical protein